MSGFEYIGSELEVFQYAVIWKAYFRSHITEHLTGDVLEVGGGIGATTELLCDGRQRSWTILEPDAALRKQAQARFAAKAPASPIDLRGGTVDDLPPTELFQAIIYIDVLEHIEDDHYELRRAAEHLASDGRLIVLAPAHNYLFSEFDRAIGHFRRYSRQMLLDAAPIGLTLETAYYLDSVGMCASLANRWFLRKNRPTLGNIRFWDSDLVRASRLIDPILRYSLGKSVLAVWSKRDVAGG
jgi:ubiquinone/menaquinone biosynthesis C-methylase UbiE